IDLLEIDADIRQGTQQDAVLHSVGANAAHGARRTNDDKRLAVKTLLCDGEWSQ
ncbi:MAG: streptomycin biosynthesis regulator, partial [Spirochaetales bacterium]|nr:streptomycin biosynthesis regulator [Spirochaetales bacterium]